jgi:hypothetical protein
MNVNEEMLATLVAAATNRKASSAQRATAERALRTTARNLRAQGFPDAAAAADRAVALVASRLALATRMGLGPPRETIHDRVDPLTGRHEVVFPAGSRTR